ncbi:MAG: 1-acyl-sn-glycerol-3-phosphate acyltransferase [Bacteroidaceae bacterium]|nr:1-acyl-sn-glycerol-3-phosphate acyltransferase [Bacteroidaceae bacterium]MBR1683444.1 1-acyl-sn-glycerol-3-phosphate acyltransferase [Bacteroidaceae bacterium]
MNEFDSIRPYNPDEVPGAIDSLLHDRQFSRILKGMVPFLPVSVSRGVLRLASVGVHTTLDFQLRFMKPIVKYVLRRCATGYSFAYDGIAPGPGRYTFISNHRDIVLDSAILDVMLYEAKFPTTCEIAIGDNLLIYPWIKTLVRLNKAFIVQRSLAMREMLNASQVMSRYMHYAVGEKHENIWIAQREGRAKDSGDRTQDSILKMMVMGGEGSVIDRLKDLHLVPLALSYEYDPCDYLKAKEFQQKRDVAGFKKSRQDDLDNMRTGIFGQKGHVHFEAAPCIDAWLDGLDPAMPKAELFPLVAQHIDHEIHRNYRLYGSNRAALDMLEGTSVHASATERAAFEKYLSARLDLAAEALRKEGLQPDTDFLRERILTMYANPAENKLRVES